MTIQIRDIPSSENELLKARSEGEQLGDAMLNVSWDWDYCEKLQELFWNNPLHPNLLEALESDIKRDFSKQNIPFHRDTVVVYIENYLKAFEKVVGYVR